MFFLGALSTSSMSGASREHWRRRLVLVRAGARTSQGAPPGARESTQHKGCGPLRCLIDQISLGQATALERFEVMIASIQPIDLDLS